MKMIKIITNFVQNLHNKFKSLYRTNEGGRTIRKTRLKKFRKKGKGIVIAVQIVAVWYILILSGSYLTSDTGAYFNDVEKISGTIGTAEDFCVHGSDYWHKYCKDNSGLGNGPDAPDVGTGKGTDPDNPGHNKGGCDDHTNAPCSDVTKKSETSSAISNDVTTSNNESDKKLSEDVTNLKGIRNGNSQNIDLSWKNPTAISYVRIYIDGKSNPIEDNVKGENIKLLSEEEVTYRVTTVDTSGNESIGETVNVK
jgi:predicted ribosomally synthesized peptide with SipW-like signal peptide